MTATDPAVAKLLGVVLRHAIAKGHRAVSISQDEGTCMVHVDDGDGWQPEMMPPAGLHRALLDALADWAGVSVADGEMAHGCLRLRLDDLGPVDLRLTLCGGQSAEIDLTATIRH
jgi:hypothetical protein